MCFNLPCLSCVSFTKYSSITYHHARHYSFHFQSLTETTVSALRAKVAPPVSMDSLTTPVSVQKGNMVTDVNVSHPTFDRRLL